ncbi:HAMP domain-containing protein, partial [Kibdelosporangium lantanae]
GASGLWRDLTESVNLMASNLTNQVRDIARVATAVARGDLTQKIDVSARGEILELKNTFNTMVDQLSSFADEVTRVAREVGTEGILGGQAQVPGVAGTWRDLTDNVNVMAENLTTQVRGVALVATAVQRGDLTQKINVDARGEMQELKNTLNTMVDQLSSFADEVTRVSREVGTEGILGGQAQVPGVAGTWRDLTDSVNFMAGNLTDQVRNIAQVTTAIARGDLTQKINVDARGEILELKNTLNTMVDQLSAFADEVTRVSREVGTEGKLGGQAQVRGVAGTWKDLTDNVNVMAENLTTQVRNIAQVTTAVANGDLTQKMDVNARGEILELKSTLNGMVDTLRAFGDEVTRGHSGAKLLGTPVSPFAYHLVESHLSTTPSEGLTFTVDPRKMVRYDSTYHAPAGASVNSAMTTPDGQPLPDGDFLRAPNRRVDYYGPVKPGAVLQRFVIRQQLGDFLFLAAPEEPMDRPVAKSDNWNMTPRQPGQATFGAIAEPQSLMLSRTGDAVYFTPQVVDGQGHRDVAA